MKPSTQFMALAGAAAAACLCCWAIDIPRIGFARDLEGRVRPIDGVSGNFVVGEPVASDATVAFAWNGTIGIRKLETSLEWWDSTGTNLMTLDAPAGAAVIGFDRSNSQTAWIYSKAAQTLVELTQGQWETVEVPAALSRDEEVLALAGNRATVDIAVKRGDGIFVATFNQANGSRVGEISLGMPGTSRVLLLQDGSIVGVTGSTIWLRRADGSQWSTDSKGSSGPDLLDLSIMGREWIQLTFPTRQLALRIHSAADPVLYTIPGRKQVVAQ
jgi:hypothetical protein